MSKKSSLTFTPVTLRIALLAGLIVVILLQAGLIALSQSILNTYSQKVASTVSVSSSDEKTLQDLENISRLLDSQKETVKKAGGITADKSNTYAYQNKIIQDLAVYGQKSGINITGWSFTDETAVAGATTGAAAPASATAAAATPGAPTGVTPVTVTLNLGPGITYNSFYTFLHLLESNLLRMEVQGVNLARPAAAANEQSSGGEVGLSSLTLQVYKR